MASWKTASQPTLPKKRPLDDAADCELEEYRKPKTVVSKYPPPKMRSGVQVVRDFPHGITAESLARKGERNPLKNVSNFDLRLGQTTSHKVVDSRSFQNHKLESFKPKDQITLERNPLKNLENVDFKHGRITSHGKGKLVHSLPFENNKLKSLKPLGLGRNNPCFASRIPAGKVKYWDPTEEGNAQKPKVRTRVTVCRPSEKPKQMGRSNPYLASVPAGKVKCSMEGDAQKAKLTIPTDNIVSRPTENNRLTSFEAKEVGRTYNNPSFASRPTGKVKYWDPTCPEERDAKKPRVTTTITVVHRPSENDELICSKPKELGRNNPSFGSRPAGKVKYWDHNCPEEGDAQKSKETIVVSTKEQVRREKIKEAMIIFDEIHRVLYEDNRSKPKEEKIAHWRITAQAAKKVQKMLEWMEAEKMLGSVCGVQVGDKFKYRSQLQMIGLHCQPQCGIDYTMIDGRNLALSIVDAHRYSNKRWSCDELTYSGQGGIPFLGNKQLPPEDQKLERGNLALRNSMLEKTPVRVIRKVQGVENSGVFVYDGLYVVEDYNQKKGEQGKMVFMFKLKRMPGQPQLDEMLNVNGSSGRWWW